MNPKQITNAYLDALRKGDLSAVVNLFSEKGEVISPVYGNMPAKTFYETLFADTKESQLILKGIFREIDKPNEFAIYFTYQWTLADGNQVKFDVVDVVVLNGAGKIETLTIIYDTQESNPAVAQLRK
ncbi:nuclear transport factor 2 family protein [Aureisphaera galaxeae]|uniref:nuclear transport factor 2 family protein n=1 Tax=Aureisphaera galaxeae TaxID=1538023 RepID=UPI002350AB2A|nr:nuclear transport factor 2 family protein [Aureisphaera galaxeae]MDC8002595.1 nuclear transport factor 2 family protein [Aureisphaera galaxeae]